MSESINVENKKQNRQKPPRSLIRIACEILSGAAAGFAVALPIRYVFGAPDAFQGCFGGMAKLSFYIFVFPPVYGLGSTVGVYLLGSRGKQTGSFLLTLVGGFLGGFVMVAAIVAASIMLPVGRREELTLLDILLLSFVLLIPPIFATYGFNLRRRYK